MTYTPVQRQEAVALARVQGAERTAEQLGIDARTVRKWMDAAGDGPELAADPGTWRALHELAMAKVTAALARGKLSPVAAATIAGIASRNAAKESRPEPEPERGPEQDWADTIEAAVAERFPVAGGRVLAVVAHRLEDLGDAEAPDIDVLLEGLPDDRDAIDAWWRDHDAACPQARRSKAYVPQPDPEMAELLAAADRALMEMTE